MLDKHHTRTIMKEKIEEKIVKSFTQMFSVQEDKINLEDSLKDAYGIDSIQIIEYIVKVEDDFGIEFEDDMLIESNIDTLKGIINILKKKVEN